MKKVLFTRRNLNWSSKMNVNVNFNNNFPSPETHEQFCISWLPTYRAFLFSIHNFLISIDQWRT